MLRQQLRAIVAEWIKSGMRRKQLSIAELAEASKISRTTIYGLLDAESPDLIEDETVAKLAEEIGEPPTLVAVAAAPRTPMERLLELTGELERLAASIARREASGQVADDARRLALGTAPPRPVEDSSDEGRGAGGKD